MKSSSRAKPRTKADLDLIDRKILSILRDEGRLTVNDLANRVGLSSSPCWSRVRHLEEIGVIKHYSAVIDHVAIGLKDIVFIEVTLDKHDDKVLARFGDALARIPEVIEANLVTGDYDYLVKALPADGTVRLEKITTQRGVLVVAGPRSRDLLAKLTDADLSDAAFPWLTGQSIDCLLYTSPSPRD